MLISTVLLTAASIGGEVPPMNVAAALKAGCHVQQVHTPAGKPVQSAPIIRCPERVAARDARDGQPARSGDAGSK